ncbi:MAG: hypothetical protein R2706_19835 [Acidimicrobiales bacterium]
MSTSPAHDTKIHVLLNDNIGAVWTWDLDSPRSSPPQTTPKGPGSPRPHSLRIGEAL